MLFVYVAAHLINHALGLVSLDAAETGLRIALRVWHSIPGTLLLYTAAAVHIALAFLALYERRTLRMPPIEWIRIVLGFMMPLLLIGHVIATRAAFELYAHAATYSRVVWEIWSSDREWRQLGLLAPGWVHGCLGLHLAFGTKRFYRRAFLSLFAAALLVPVLAAAGFVTMAKELAFRARDPAPATAAPASIAAERASVGALRDAMLGGFGLLVAGVLVARELRGAIEARRRMLVTIRIAGRPVQVPRGWSVLEASRGHGIAHTSMCGGRARCSTCRVRVLEGLEHCPPAAEAEHKTLVGIAAAEDTRLACQLRPTGDVAVMPLVESTGAPRQDLRGAVTTDRQVAVLLLDLPDTPSGEAALPHDLLYALNLVGESFNRIMQHSGGTLVQIGADRCIAAFGLESPIEPACRQVLRASSQLARELAALQSRLATELGVTIDCTLCLHAGPAAVGSLQSEHSRHLQVVGAPMRLAQTMATAADTGVVAHRRLLVSADVLRWAGMAPPAPQLELPDARFRNAGIAVFALDPEALPAR